MVYTIKNNETSIKHMLYQNVLNQSFNDEFYDVWMIFYKYVYFMCFLSYKIAICVKLVLISKFYKM